MAEMDLASEMALLKERVRVLEGEVEGLRAPPKFREDNGPGPIPQGEQPFERIPAGDHRHPAVQAYRDAYRRYPPKASYYELAEMLGDDPKVIRAWHAHCVACAKRGWNAGNVAAVMDTWRKAQHDPYRTVGA